MRHRGEIRGSVSMTILIAVYDSDGCRGRCDARCYEAVEPDCDCVCGGLNHGAGRQKAITNTRRYAEVMLAEYSRSHHLKDWRGEVSDTVRQLPLL
jgi:hypothetical protein